MDVSQQSSSPYGLLAEFEQGEELLAAAHAATAAGYRQMNGYTPFPLEGLHEALGQKPTRLPLLTLVGGIAMGPHARTPVASLSTSRQRSLHRPESARVPLDPVLPYQQTGRRTRDAGGRSRARASGPMGKWDPGSRGMGEASRQCRSAR